MVKSIRHCRKIYFQELKTDYFATAGRKTAPISPHIFRFGREGMKNAANRRGEILSLCFFPPEIPPSAPLQTQDGSAVATVKRTLLFGVLLFFFFFNLLGPVAADCAEIFVIYAKTIQQTPDDKSTPASNIGMEGGGANSSTGTPTLVRF